MAALFQQLLSAHIPFLIDRFYFDKGSEILDDIQMEFNVIDKIYLPFLVDNDQLSERS